MKNRSGRKSNPQPQIDHYPGPIPSRPCKACTLEFVPPRPRAQGTKVDLSRWCDDCRPLHAGNGVALDSVVIEEAFARGVHFRMAIEDVRRGLRLGSYTPAQAADILDNVITQYGGL